MRRTGGVADVALTNDGATLTVADKVDVVHAAVAPIGPIEGVIDVLRTEHDMHVPGAHLIVADL